MRFRTFSIRNGKEIARDPLSYVFCLGFPMIMLIIMTFVNKGIPKEANMVIFRIDYLSSGIAVFGLSFVMLFTCLQVSKDRSSAFLIRLYVSPMKATDYILGYTIPLMVIAFAQITITFVAASIIGLITGYTLSLVNILLGMITLLPTVMLYIGFGMLFGSLLNEKAAPGIASIVITLSAILGGVWMDVDSLSGGLKEACEVLPFYHGVQASQMAVLGRYCDIPQHIWIVSLYAMGVYLLAVLIFQHKMQRDIS